MLGEKAACALCAIRRVRAVVPLAFYITGIQQWCLHAQTGCYKMGSRKQERVRRSSGHGAQAFESRTRR